MAHSAPPPPYPQNMDKKTCLFFKPLPLTYCASFTDFEDDIFVFISNFPVQGTKFGGKFSNVAENLKKVELHKVHGVRFFQVCYTIEENNI